MAATQSRRSVSLVREDHTELQRFCAARRIPISQAVSQAVRALLGGRLELEPARPMLEVMAATCARRGLPLPWRPPVVLTVPAVAGTCASCTDPSPRLIPSRLEAEGPPHWLCERCHGERL